MEATHTVTSDPEADTPEFTLSCSSSDGPVSGFSCTNANSGIVNGTASLTDPTSGIERSAANYNLMVTVTGNYPGTYTCTLNVGKYDGIGVEPKVLTYTGPQTICITVTGKHVSLHISLLIHLLLFLSFLSQWLTLPLNWLPHIKDTLKVYWTPPPPTCVAT